MRRVLLSLLPIIPLTNCVAPPARPPVSAPRPVTAAPPPVAQPAPPRADTGVEPGIWTYASEPHGSTARFGVSPQSMVFAIQCDRMIRAVSLMVARPGAVTGGSVTLRATTTVKSFPTEGGGPYAIVRVPVRDPILDALAFSRGRFGVALDGVERAYPTWPEFTRVIEDCRG